ncbi:retrovirus-related pol polyprotein from transposon TNT 1-94, partial [Trifolium medium]|nr:retrovirus-related pol polyprotein from transposon TNT 1-94 [Trifolium medium]
LIQEAQFDKFRQELANPSVSANVAQTEPKSSEFYVDQDTMDSGTEYYNAGKGKRTWQRPW